MIPGLDGPDTLYKGAFQNAPAGGPEYETEQSAFEVLAFSYHDYINVSGAARLTREGIGVIRSVSSHV